MPDTPAFPIIHAQPSFDPSVVYDVDIALPICGEVRYQHRLDCFKRAGLYHLAGLRIHLTLIGGPRDWEHRAKLLAGWPPECAVTLLIVGHDRPLPKINAYYLWQQESSLQTRWRLRVDDDSITDVGGLIRAADARYGTSAVHVMTEPYVNGSGIAVLTRCLQEQGTELPMTMHEHECSLSSAAAMRQVFATQAAMDFLHASSEHVYHPGDQVLALAMQVAGVPLAISPWTRKDFHLDKISLAGGDLLHIHYVDWEKPGFVALAAALVQGERRPLQESDFADLVDRPMMFGRCIGHVMAELLLHSDGRVEGAIDENESCWRRLEDNLLLTRPNGITTTSFHTLLTHGPRRWLLGAYLYDTSIHFLRLS